MTFLVNNYANAFKLQMTMPAARGATSARPLNTFLPIFGKVSKSISFGEEGTNPLLIYFAGRSKLITSFPISELLSDIRAIIRDYRGS